MARLRYNGLSTTLGGSLTNVATSVTFAAALTHSNGTNVPTIVSPDYIPLAILGATGHLSEIVYLTGYTAGATTGTITRGQEGTAGAAHSSGDAVTQAPLAADIPNADGRIPTGYVAESGMGRMTFSGATSLISTGGMYFTAVHLPAGYPVGHIAFFTSTTAAVTPTHCWFGLYDSSRVQLATTADQLTAAWAANTLKSLAIATTAAGSASTFTTTYEGLYYVSYSMSAGTMPVLVSTPMNVSLTSVAPTIAGNITSPSATPPAFPSTAGAFGTISGNIPWCAVGA